MRQIAVISGKGGTGKTIISASLAVLSAPCVTADCDVDAANMHLMLRHSVLETYEFRAGQMAGLDRKKCIECQKCVSVCRFKAVDKNLEIDPFSCEGCGLCAKICAAGAITMKESIAGEWFVSGTDYGPFVHAKLGIAEDNSGKLVSRVREAARKKAEEAGLDTVIIDGPPGTGCAAMAAITGADFVIIVTEPTVSGLHDLKRAAEVVRHFKIKAGVIVNKYDLNSGKSGEIELFCAKEKLSLLGKIAFSECVPAAVNKGVPPLLECGETAAEIRECREALLREAKITVGKN